MQIKTSASATRETAPTSASTRSAATSASVTPGTPSLRMAETVRVSGHVDTSLSAHQHCRCVGIVTIQHFFVVANALR